MKKLKNLVILGLLVITAVVLVPSVFAVFDNDSIGSIEVNGLEKGVTVSAYRLMVVNIDNEQPRDPIYSWATDELATWIRGKSAYSSFVAADSNAVTEAFSTSSEADRKKFYDELANDIKGGNLSISVANTATADEDGKATIGSLKMGNYLILAENGMKIYEPLSANVVAQYDDDTGKWNVSDGKLETVKVNEKSSKPEVDKTVKVKDSEEESVNDIQAKIGTKLTYTVDADVPKYPENAIYKNLKISDTLTGGLTFDKDSVVVYGVNGSSRTPLTEGYTLTKNDDGFVLEFTTEQYEATLEGKYAKVVVEYDATINENAVVVDSTNTAGNINTAKLEYNNNPYSKGTYDGKDEDIVHVYTYGIKINKKGTGKDANGLAGVKFEIAQGNNTLCFKETETAGTYVYTGVKGSSGCAEGDTEVTTPTGGNLVLKGLDEGTYEVTETYAPEDYVKAAKMQFTIDDTDTLDGVVTVDGDLVTTDGYVENNVINTKGFTLPVTGGIGTLIFSIIGIVFMGVSAFLIRNIFKKKEVKNI